MQRKTVIATLVAAAFALPFAATAGGTYKKTAANDGGAQAMFKSMDKDADGYISKEEAANTPHSADFAKLDTNADGKLSAEEHANAKEHVAARTAAKTDAAVTTSTATPK